MTEGGNMKRVSILVIAFLSASLTQVGLAQVGSPTNTDSSSQTKQEKPSPNKEKQAQGKAKSTKPPIKAETGKKTTTSQDAAHALAARKGNPEPAAPPK
jgi:hypothetical protein